MPWLWYLYWTIHNIVFWTKNIQVTVALIKCEQKRQLHCFLLLIKKLFALWDNHEPLYTVGTGSKAGAMVKRNYIFLCGAMNSSTMASLAGALCDNYGDDDDVLFDFSRTNDVCPNLIPWIVYARAL